MPSPHLRVTRRCLEADLEFQKKDVDRFVRLDARDFKDVHACVKKFVSMRGQAPDSGDRVHGPWPHGRIRSLHVGEARSVTILATEEDACWLLAFNDYHRIGDPNDAYNYFIDLYNAGDLLPDDEDYEVFFETTDADDEEHDGVMALQLLEELAETSAALLAEARATPSVEAVRTFRVNGRQIMCVDALVEVDGRAEEGWMSLRLPDDEYLDDTDLYELLTSILPPGVQPIYETKFRDRDRMPGEIIYRWDHWEHE